MRRAKGRRRGDPRRRGFTLIEVLVALMILSVGATSVLALFAAAAATHKRSVDRTRAALVAERVVAEAQSAYTPGLDAEALRAALYERLPETIDGYAWDVEALRPGAEREKKSALARISRPATGGKAGKAAAGPKGPKDAKGKTGAAAAPSPPAKKASTGESAGWSPDELLLRVSVAWSQGGRVVTEEYTTLVLPRAAPPEAKKKR